MRNYAAGAVLLGLLAGCSADWNSAETAGKVIASAKANNTDPRSANFATLPDRGELLAYAPDSAMRADRRAYEVRLSEAHAFKAAREGGRIVVPGPDGGTMVFTYRRHIEHADGNWTWIGRDAGGADAVITFGEKAVFGTLRQSDGEILRLTTLAGRAWLMRGDRIGAMGPRRNGRSDALTPQDEAAEAGRSQSESPGAHSAITMVAGDGPAATVDVLLGYTVGYARALGGESEAVTRLNNLIDVANQAYANSDVNAQLRLVGTVAVDYPDTTANADTLKRLTGSTERAFAGLRAARESHAADLVALVRSFRAPQNEGCGAAWLIGGGGAGFDVSRAPYGYAVVGDGADIDETDDLSYFCREESLAHEFGHSMGQAHDRDDSRQAGVHAYAYGYREPSNNGFYTVMAYALPDGDQIAIPYFASPHATYEDRPTGVMNEADNVRSMNQTIPIVAAFRTGDLDGAADPSAALAGQVRAPMQDAAPAVRSTD
ncbi:reprolysin-like metallopeptidase [Luteimonas gilva]|nr:M12 family metallo-peptidase [Luteimonas gilva]